MRFVIVSRGDERSESIKNKMINKLTQHHLEYDEITPELIISVGGDGTFLHAFHQYKQRLHEVAFIGVHTGHLGFYADWTPEEVDDLILEIAHTPYQVAIFPLLEVIIKEKNGLQKNHFLALNESTIKSAYGSVVFDVEIRGENFETFRGDGLCVSTPSGSTAYNKALGGGIIHPSLEAFQVTEMASINNRVFRTIGSPLILPSHHVCVLRPLVEHSYIITIDHLVETYKDVESVEYRVAKEKIRLARYRPVTFWNRVRDSFIAECE